MMMVMGMMSCWNHSFMSKKQIVGLHKFLNLLILAILTDIWILNQPSLKLKTEPGNSLSWVAQVWSGLLGF